MSASDNQKPQDEAESIATLRTSDGFGDDGEYTCSVCGVKQLPLGWPSLTLCGQCGRKRDMKEPKACPFCGIVAAMGVQENDGSKFWMTCMVCDAQGPKSDLQDLAVWEWNKRKSPNDKLSQPADSNRES